MLCELLRKVPSERICLVTKKQSLTYSDILSQSHVIFRKLNHNQNVALIFTDPVKLILSLIHCDQNVNRVLLLSPSIEISTVKVLLNNAQIDTILTDIPTITGIENCYLIDDNFQRSQGIIISKSSIETEWVLATSGTTGVPKLVAHSFSSLIKSTRIDIDKGKDYIWGQLYDPSRFAGLQVLLQSLLSGSKLVSPLLEDALNDTIDFLVQSACNAISATPSMWRKIVMCNNISNMALKRISLGGEIADQSILTALNNLFPNAKITHIYASTEAGVGFSVNDHKAGFPLEFLERQDIDLKIENNTLYVGNSFVKKNYLGQDNFFSDSEHYVNTGDIVRIDGDRVHFVGRQNGTINVGGNKLLPEEVEKIIISVHDVVQSRVYGVKNPILGSLVMADIVINPETQRDHNIIISELKKTCEAQLENWKRPVKFNVRENIELSTGQKILRN